MGDLGLAAARLAAQSDGQALAAGGSRADPRGDLGEDFAGGLDMVGLDAGDVAPPRRGESVIRAADPTGEAVGSHPAPGAVAWILVRVQPLEDAPDPGGDSRPTEIVDRLRAPLRGQPFPGRRVGDQLDQLLGRARGVVGPDEQGVRAVFEPTCDPGRGGDQNRKAGAHRLRRAHAERLEVLHAEVGQCTTSEPRQLFVVLALHADHVGARETVAHHFAADVFLDLSLLVGRVVGRTAHDDRDHVLGLLGRQLARLA